MKPNIRSFSSRVSNWSQDNERVFLDAYLPQQLGLKEKEDWYKVTEEDIIKHGGDRLLKTKYKGSVRRIAESVHPDHKWLPWRFSEPTLPGTWNSIEMQREYMEYLGKELKITEMKDWYNITQLQIQKHGGAGLLNKYNGSPSKMIMSLLTDHPWSLWQFSRIQTCTWNDIQMQREFMKHLSTELGIRNMEDWYYIMPTQICKHGGAGLLNKYNGSPSRMIMSLLTDHKWKSNQFQERTIWKNTETQREFVENLTNKLKLTKTSDWYDVTQAQIIEKGGAGLLMKYQNSPSKMITSILSGHIWDLQKFTRRGRKDIETKHTEK
eukprot:TRINITY_DN2498_c0_g1_i1.p1 TRINITY_DN2498_c0_g1~~TRINITY_DN2498_c0_g1_i1.p1  ORF type:complete len:323 (-),score=51.17 TRINITY_DN2498_c0_g1_i1:3-971(-)